MQKQKVKFHLIQIRINPQSIQDEKQNQTLDKGDSNIFFQRIPFKGAIRDSLKQEKGPPPNQQTQKKFPNVVVKCQIHHSSSAYKKNSNID